MNKRRFQMVVLNRDNVEPNLSDRVKSVLAEPEQFDHITWPRVEKFIRGLNFARGGHAYDVEQRFLLRYLNAKTSGYANGALTTLLTTGKAI